MINIYPSTHRYVSEDSLLLLVCALHKFVISYHQISYQIKEPSSWNSKHVIVGNLKKYSFFGIFVSLKFLGLRNADYAVMLSCICN